jgi:hypothetical protein
MREVRVYDDERHVIWPEELAPGEHAVFYVDAEKGHHRNEQGYRIHNYWTRTCPVFESLDAARSHARAAVKRTSSISVRIYSAEDPETPVEVVEAETAEQRADPRHARRALLIGFACLAAAFVGFGIDWYFEWFYLLGVIIGSKFLVFGIAKIVEGLSERHALRARAAAAAAAASGGDAAELVRVADDVDRLDAVRSDLEREHARDLAVDRDDEAGLAVDLGASRGERRGGLL